MKGYILDDIKGGLATISFYHPAHNSLPGHLLAELSLAIQEAGEDPDVRVILLRSEGEKSFCAGASFDELASISDFAAGKQFFLGFARVILAMKNCPKPIVGRIQGKAIGGGVGLASAMDYPIATQYASIRLSELAVGIGPFVIGPAVERKMGASIFQKLALSPDEWQTAAWAKQHGLYHEVFDTAEQMDAYLEVFIASLLQFNPEALCELKRVFWSNTDHWENLLDERAGISGRLVLSEFCKTAIQKFKQKS
ncbi:MAG TPA: enoyl-CoA hydratase/isomerase family protein [Saprospiraceae bacterium]|nr:enoyl-CoA hydratase/isomerase family protein [Saprospiraceae bacterium]